MPHLSRIVNIFLQQEGIIKIGQPKKSSDCNHIEHSWNKLVSTVNEMDDPSGNYVSKCEKSSLEQPLFPRVQKIVPIVLIYMFYFRQVLLCSRRHMFTCVWCYIHDINLHDYDDVIKWKYFSHYWTFARGIHRSPVMWIVDVSFDLRLNKRLSK